eukprot:8312775-Ditylum_brightwellii.AAC.1
MGRVSMPRSKDDIGKKIQDIACSCLAEGLEEAIRLTLEEKHQEWEDRGDTHTFPGEEPLIYKEWLLLPPGH